jgi:hypothetical protein
VPSGGLDREYFRWTVETRSRETALAALGEASDLHVVTDLPPREVIPSRRQSLWFDDSFDLQNAWQLDLLTA